VATECINLTISGGREAPARARAALGALNGSLSGVREDVRLLVTELVTNAVVHGGAGPETPIEVRVRTTPQAVRAEIEHPGPQFEPRPRPDEQHYGLFLVEQIADRWGVEPLGGRNRAWFEVARA
jgi:anti-sigma regulatory factor (Ser/Thr protein kinase)